MIFNVNRELLTLKSLYFFELSVIACLFIYMTPFMNEWGITASEMAVITFVANIFGLFSRPFFGYIADKFQKYKELIIILTFLCGIVYSLHLLSPKHPKPVIYTLNNQFFFNVSSDLATLTIYSSNQPLNSCWPSYLNNCLLNKASSLRVDMILEQINNNSVTFGILPKNVSFIYDSKSLICGNLSLNCNKSHHFKESFNNVGLTWSATFWILGLAKTIGYILYSPIVSLTDAVTFVTLGSSNANKFGFTRMFGTIGVLVFSLIMAGILQAVNLWTSGNDLTILAQMQRFSQFTPCFIMAVIIFIVIMVTALFLRYDNNVKTEMFLKSQSRLSRFLEKMSLDILFRDWEIGIFFLFTVIGGFVLSMFSEYYFLILFQRYKYLPKYFPGLVTVVMTVSESVVLGFSSNLLQYKDYEFWVSLSFLMWSIKWFSYIFTENFWILLIIESLHGPSFGLMLSSMMAHIGKIGTSTTQGRLQGLFSAIYFNIGGALGGLVGGIILDNFGMFGLFKFMSILSLLCCSYYPIQKFIIRRSCTRSLNCSEVIVINDDEENCNGKLLSLNSIA